METMTHSLSRLQDGLWIAGTADGARVAVDPEAWFDVFDGTEARSFRTLAAVSDGVLAGAEDGLWFSPDGHTWIRRDGLTEPVLAMTVDTQEENAVWIVTTSGLHHTQDSGSTVGPLLPIPVPLRDVTSVASLGFGRFLVGGGDGVVETTDGGVTWALKNQGLERVNGARIVMSDRTHVLLVAGGRVYQLKEVGAEQDEELIEQLEPWIPLDELVYSAVSRSGMTEVMNPRRLRIRSYFVPQLRLEGRFRDYSDLNFDRFNGTAFDTRGELLVLGLLTWTPRVRTRTDLGVLTSDMQDPLVILGDGGLTAALRVNQNLARYHAQVSDLVIERYRARMRLVRERPRLQNLSLLSRVLHELGVQHVEADLDVLTEGAVGRWYLERRMASESMEL